MKTNAMVLVPALTSCEALDLIAGARRAPAQRAQLHWTSARPPSPLQTLHFQVAGRVEGQE